MGKIIIRQLPVSALIGTLPEERMHRQRLILDLDVETDMRKAAVSDDLADAVDYSRIETMVLELAEKSSFFLLEALAGAIGSAVSAMPGVTTCLVRIEKPAAVKTARSLFLEAAFEKGKMLP